MKQTKRFLRSKTMLRDVETFRYGFTQGAWATNGVPYNKRDPITIESIMRSLKVMESLINAQEEIAAMQMRYFVSPRMFYPVAPKLIVFPLVGV